jgi:NAD(P)-dependent dehydrogenase (short-subunit alcohol dehydrogenase family)
MVAQHGYACYGATKAGVEPMTKVLALEWAPFNITVNAIAPTTTPSRPPDVARLATPEDVIGAALCFASPAASFVTGQTLTVDGGLSLP